MIAIILTQRPRPSYLLGFGVLLVWIWLVLVAALVPSLRRFDDTYLLLFILAVLVIVFPSYSSLKLPSKAGNLGFIYSKAKPHAESLCAAGGKIGASEYLSELSSYLCAPYRSRNNPKATKILGIGGGTGIPSIDPHRFVAELHRHHVIAVIVDPSLIQKNPGLGSCEALREAFLSSSWTLLGYRAMDSGRCVATYRFNK